MNTDRTETARTNVLEFPIYSASNSYAIYSCKGGLNVTYCFYTFKAFHAYRSLLEIENFAQFSSFIDIFCQYVYGTSC